MGWTRNYYNLLTGFLLGDTTELSSNTPVDYQPPVVIRHQDGTYDNRIYYASGDIYTPEMRTRGTYYDRCIANLLNLGKTTVSYNPYPNTTGWDSYDTTIQFGTGDTAADYEDYQLETPITTGLSVVNTSGTLTAPSAFDDVTHKYSSTRTFTFNNTSASSITIKELGIFLSSVLCYREVLDSPITIEPAESVTVSFTREATVFNYTPY